MSSQNQSTPDLATVLKTLAALNPQNHQKQSENLQSDSIMAPESPPYEPAPANVPAPTLESFISKLAKPAPSSKGATQPKVVDPTSINDWPTGLRSVMKTFANNEAIVKDIQRLIMVQHEHEQQWWKAREDLIEKQKARVEGQKQIDSILKGVGGNAGEKSEVSAPEALVKELTSFDMKVYKAQLQMNQEFTTKLRGLGIPFFGTKSNLVRRKGDKTKLEKGMIAEVELVKLQRKMLDLLEDMSKGD